MRLFKLIDDINAAYLTYLVDATIDVRGAMYKLTQDNYNKIRELRDIQAQRLRDALAERE